MLHQKEVKSILNKTKRRDPWFLDDYTINLYSSCSFNCLYCYIRGSKYGENLEEKLTIKTNAIEVLDRQLFNRAKKEQYGIIVLSSATDPYLQVDQEHQLTRQALELIHKYKFPVHVLTKSNAVIQDFDLLNKIHQDAILPKDLQGKLSGGTILSFSFSTLQDHVAKIFESGATPPSQRLKAVREAVKNDFKTGISLMPLLPFISDTKEALHNYFDTFSKIGVDYILPASITLFGNQKADSKPLVMRAVKKHFPELEAKYIQYFSQNRELPAFYRKAFKGKMKELKGLYNLSDSII